MNEPETVWQQASELHWFVPPFSILDIPMPANEDSLSRSRKVSVPVSLVGVVVPVDRVVSWDFEPIKTADAQKH